MDSNPNESWLQVGNTVISSVHIMIQSIDRLVRLYNYVFSKRPEQER
jgi:hypothetical protein